MMKISTALFTSSKDMAVNSQHQYEPFRFSNIYHAWVHHCIYFFPAVSAAVCLFQATF